MNDKVKLNSGKTLSKFLENVFDEGVKAALYQKALQEKEKQAGTAGVDLFGDSGKNKPAETTAPAADPSTTPEPEDVDKQALEKGEVSATTIVDKLNSIRSGKSFKDSVVKSRMEQYVNTLKTPEKTALLAFLKGIAQIVTGEVPEPEATAPASDPADVEMKKGETKKVVHVKPNLIKGAPVKKPAAKPEENTAAPVPITPTKK